MTPTPLDQRIAQIVEEFDALEDLMDRYRHLIEMGDAMPGLPEAEKNEESYISGCQYDIWIRTVYDPDHDRLHFRADSDARISRGMAALILRVLDGQRPQVVANAPLDFLERIGLRAQLSAQRNNGLSAMIEEIRGRARQHTSTTNREVSTNGSKRADRGGPAATEVPNPTNHR